MSTSRPWDARATYDALAADYAQENAGEPSGHLAAERERLAGSLPAGARVLDAGCGTGRDLAFFAGRGLCAVGVDVSLGMLRQGSGKPVAQASLTALPFAAAAFDAGWSALALMHLPLRSQQRALAEVARVLKRGAVLTVLTVAGQAAYAETVAYRPDLWRLFHPLTPGGLAEVAARAGLEVLESSLPRPEPGRRPMLVARLRRI